MIESMKMFCESIHLSQITHYEAHLWLNDLCIDYGTESVASWLIGNDKKAIEWLNQEAA